MTAFKKPLCSILAVVLTIVFISAAPLTAFAADDEPLYSAAEIELNKKTDENGFEYIKVEDDSAIEVVGYTGTETEVSVPSKIAGLSVISIGASAFEGNEAITKVKLHNDITSLGEKAFKDCISLKEVEKTKSLETIGASAFEGCTAIEKFKIPDNVTNVPEKCFFGATALVEVDDHTNLKNVAKDAFAGTKWENDKEDGPLNLGRVLYSYKGEVKDVVIPEGVSIIEEYAFIGNDSMETLTLGFDVEEIGLYAFQNCVNLKTITTNEALGVISAGAFKGCVSLESIDLTDTTTATIGYQAFADCVSLKEIKFCETLSEIGEYAFKGTALKTIELFKNVNSISANSFLDVKTLESFSVVDKNKEFTAIDGVLYNKKVKSLVCMPAAKTGTFEIPASVEEIRDEAFYDSAISELKLPEDTSLKYIGISAFENALIEKITIPENVEKLNSNTFKNAKKLSSVTFEEGITYIGASAFEGAKALTEIVLPASLDKIGNSAFKNTGLKSVNTGDGVAEIASFAFAGNKSLTDLYIGKNVEKIGDGAFLNATSLVGVKLPASLIYISGNAFEGAKKLAKVAVDKDSKNLKAINNVVYSADGKTLVFVGNAKATSVSIANGTETIAENAFAIAKNVSAITFPATLKNIKGDALNATAWYNLKSGAVYAGPVFYKDKGAGERVGVISGTTAIADGAFKDSKAVMVSLPSTLTIIGANAFEGSAITSVTLPDSVVDLGVGAFKNAKALKSAVLSNKLEEIKASTFKGCEKLGDIKVPESVKTISADAFAGCKALKSAELPQVVEIEQYAFVDCVALAEITFPATLESFDASAFSGCTALKAINVEDGSKKYASAEGVILVANEAEDETADLVFETIALYPAGKDGVYTVPEYVKNIADRAFYDCDALEGIEFHASFSNIGKEAFFDCDKIQSIVMPESARDIGDHAFASCDNLREFVVYSNLTDYADNAFEGCNYFNYDAVTINVADSSGMLLAIIAGVFVAVGVVWYLVYNKKQKKIQAEIIEKNKIKEAMEQNS